mgnify:CR=1
MSFEVHFPFELASFGGAFESNFEVELFAMKVSSKGHPKRDVSTEYP